MSDAVNDFLMNSGGGAPSASFPVIGTVWRGTILKSEVRQQSEPDGTLKTWPDGNPMMQIVITIQTEERDAAIDDDDGKRRLFVKGQMQEAVRDAVIASGAKGLELGGTIAVAYIADGVPKQRGFSAPKQYRAEYAPPSPTAATNALLGGAPTTPAPAPQPAAVSGGSLI